MRSTFVIASLALAFAACTTEDGDVVTRDVPEQGAPIIESFDLALDSVGEGLRFRVIVSDSIDPSKVDGVLLDDDGTALGIFVSLEGNGAFAIDLTAEELRPLMRSQSGVRKLTAEFYNANGDLTRRTLEVPANRLSRGHF